MGIICGMTGYGKSEARLRDGSSILIELRTVNSKFFEVAGRIPETLSTLEERVRIDIHNKIKRGRVNVGVVYKKVTNANKDNLLLDIELAKKYYRLLAGLKKTFALKGSPELSHLIAIPNLITYKEKELHLDEIWPKLKETLDNALKDLVGMRQNEGRTIYKDLMSHLKDIEKSLSQIKGRYPATLKQFRVHLRKRIKKWRIDGLKHINDSRVEQEVVMLAEDSDISEEVSRTSGHIGLFHTTLNAGGEAGKKLDFITQEMHREINTIGSKSRDFVISKKVIGIKVALERMREQLQNVE